MLAGAVMGITYTIDTSLGIMFAKWSGTITANDLREHWKMLIADSDAMSCNGSISNIGDCCIKFNGTDLNTLTRNILKPAFNGKTWKVAVVVQESYQHGTSRQFASYVTEFANVEIFQDTASALIWILQ